MWASRVATAALVSVILVLVLALETHGFDVVVEDSVDGVAVEAFADEVAVEVFVDEVAVEVFAEEVAVEVFAEDAVSAKIMQPV